MLVAESLKVSLKSNRGSIGSRFSGERLPQLLQRNSKHPHYLNASGYLNNCYLGRSYFGMSTYPAQPRCNPRGILSLRRQHPAAIRRQSQSFLIRSLLLVLRQRI